MAWADDEPPAVEAQAEQTTVEPMELLVDGRRFGEVQTRVTIQGRVLEVEAEPLWRALLTVAKPENLERFKELPTRQGLVRLDALNEAGLPIEFDEDNFRIVVVVPAVWRPLNVVRFSGMDSTYEEGEFVEPADLSGYLNIRGRTSYTHEAVTAEGRGSGPLGLSLEGAWNFKQFVVEGQAFFEETGEYPLQRGDVRLVRDDVEHLLRYTVGDLLLPTTGFQGFVPLGGVSVQREFSIEPFSLFYPAGLVDLFLESETEIEVRVNGQLVRTAQLPAGSHRFRDFNLTTGINDVTLTLRDRFGKIRTIHTTFFSDSLLLAEGVHAFSYNFGFPQTLVNGEREYDTSTPTFSLFHRYGLSPQLTIGGNAQGSPQQALLGGDASWVNSLGSFSLDLAASDTERVDPDVAVRLGYTRRNPGTDLSRYNVQWSASAQYLGRFFAPLGTLDPDNRTMLSFSLGVSLNLPLELSMSSSVSYDVGRGGAPDQLRNSLNFTRRLGEFGFGNVNMTRVDDGVGDAEYILFLGVTLLFDAPGGGRFGVFSSFDSSSEAAVNEWRYYAANSIGALEPSLRHTYRPDRQDLLAELRYQGRRVEVDARHSYGLPNSGGTTSRTDLTFGTALVFAQDTFAISRPIHNSFAIVAPRKELRGQKIGVNPQGDTFVSKADLFGPAVVPDLTAYSPRRISVLAPELAEGLSLGQGEFVVKPAYRSGARIRVGQEGTISIEGTLQDMQGRPIALQAGDFIPLDKGADEAEPFFTDRQGRFFVENIKQGEYRIEMYYAPDATAGLTIPAKAKGIVDGGIIQLKGPME